MNTPSATFTSEPSGAESRTCVWRLARHARSVGRARGRFRSQAGRWRLAEDATETAVLLLSELVTNAVRHSRVPGRHVEVRCVLTEAALRVEVSDAGHGVPVLREADDEDESGRGLALVAALAQKWGVLPRLHGIGKTVWCEIALRRAQRASS
ncbi:ATP-binding protein [Actinacidiphila acidipaludis]|uniref:ATP-binding protein n=1 Tax=Actinacidiphila acidipaludis TaxID=2873382 RepID=A0ABS7Q837_9ACTN|nr:ATP-binding protein [Streptomyces acidipaludis]MBY8879310.1 ATP-binding protein [Streptomyces acidipaludis]